MNDAQADEKRAPPTSIVKQSAFRETANVKCENCLSVHVPVSVA